MLLRYLVHEAGNRVARGPAVKHSLLRGGKYQMALCSREGDVAEPALLFHLALLAYRAYRWEYAVLHTSDKDPRKLKPLRGVHRHHNNAVILVLKAVEIGIKGDLVEEACEGRRLFVLHIAHDIRLELLDILHLCDILVPVAEVGEIPCFIEQDIVKLVERPRTALGAKLKEELREFHKLFARP